MLTVLRDFLGMIRFSHTIFALPFALVSAVLAWQRTPFQWPQLAGIILCMVLARSAAMAFNRLVDRRFDAVNPRTAGRHLVTGRLSVSGVRLFAVVCGIGFIASTAMFLLNDPPNPWPLVLAVPVLVFICVYSLTKRFTRFAHFWLGASLMLVPVATWIAIRGMHDLLVPIIAGAAVFFWVSGFDVIYACQDFDIDRSEKLHSIPARYGVPESLRFALACHILMLLILVVLGFAAPELGAIYFVGLTAIAALVGYEHWLVRPDDLTRVNRAFFQANAAISLGFFAIVLIQVLAG